MTSKSNKNHLNHDIFFENKKNLDNELNLSNSKRKKFLLSNYNNIKKINLIKNQFKKNMSQKDITEKTMSIFDKVIENEKERKLFLKIELFNPQVIKTDSSEKSQKKTLEYEKKHENKLLKEVIIFKNKNKNKVKNEFICKSTHNKINFFSINKKDNKYMNRIMSLKNQLNKSKFNEILLKDLNNFNTRNDLSDNGDNNIMINSNFLKSLFERNMNKKMKNNIIYKTNYNRNYKSKRMIYYNTGMYDMPLASHLSLKKKIHYY